MLSSLFKTLPSPSALFRMIASALAIMAVFWTVWSFSEVPELRGNEFLDAGEWEIASYTVTNNIRFVILIIVSVVIGIIANCLFYFWDLHRSQSAIRDALGKDSPEINYCIAINFLALGVCCAWLAYIIYNSALIEAWDKSAILPSPFRVTHPLAISNIFALFLFILFLVEDLILSLSAKSALEAAGSEQENLKAIYRYATDSIYMIDLPVIVGSILLLVFSFFEQQSQILGNGLTQSASFFYPSELARNPSYLDHAQLIRHALNAPVNIGFAGGAHVTQLFMSQVIFWVLAFRNK